MDRDLMTKCPCHPGELLKELFMVPLKLSVRDLANRLDVAPESLADFVAGNAAITVDLAMRLSQAFGNTPEFWLNAQRNVDVWRARQGDQAWRLIQPICTPLEQLESA